MAKIDTLLISFSNDPKGIPLIIVGRKMTNVNIEIINAFQGDEALEIYNKLVEREGESK